MATPGDRLGERVPACDTDNPAELEAWYGNFGFANDWRKVVLANCKEMVRARYELANGKVSETRIDDLARLEDNYLTFLTTHLNGRRLREEQLKQAIGMGA